MLDYHKILEVDRDADDKTIKASYRKLVLKYHPDKNPEDPETAAEKIRQINDAYETLSNPTKRAAWEMQMAAMDRKARGVRLQRTTLEPRIHIPTNFMICPMGYPDKFLRAVGSNCAFQAREDVQDLNFEMFFDESRFQLWWIPASQSGNIMRNNMCRMRRYFKPGQPTGLMLWGSKSQKHVGLNLSFGLSADTHTSDIFITPADTPPQVNVVVVSSPDYEKAFRFESAYYPGHFLAFCPPTQVQMVSSLDEFAIVDFLLYDIGEAEKYKTVDEILTPVVISYGGDKTFIDLDLIMDNGTFKMDFRKIKSSMWDVKDFETYFQAHWERWDYDLAKRKVRLRSVKEILQYSLKRAQTPPEILSILGCPSVEADKHFVSSLPLDTTGHILSVLACAAVAFDVSFKKALPSGISRILTSLSSDNFLNAQLTSLVSLWRGLEALNEKMWLDSEMDTLRRQHTKDVEARVTRVLGSEKCELDFAALADLLEVPLDWAAHGAVVSQAALKLVGSQPLEKLVPLIRKAATCNVRSLSEPLCTAAMMKTFGAPPLKAVEALDAVASAGVELAGVSMTLKMFLGRVPLDACIRVLATLGHSGHASEDFKAACKTVAEDSGMTQAPLGTLIDILAAARSSSVLACGPLASAASIAVRTQVESTECAVEELARLLVIVSRGVRDTDTAQSSEFVHMCSALRPVVADALTAGLTRVSASRLPSIVDRLAADPSCIEHLNSALVQAANDMSALRPSQVLVLTRHAKLLDESAFKAVSKLVDAYWQSMFIDKPKQPPTENARHTAVTSQHLSADGMAELLMLLGSKLSRGEVLESIASALLENIDDITPCGAKHIASVCADNSKCPAFQSKRRLLRLVHERHEGKCHSKRVDERDRSRSRTRREHVRR
eukprot:TRINITY_DN25453_c0_g2_i1.p1 TRINITY_DN25453_c0_g2~~TRINITY_DN25453_c0_g2_i1.p1  ORF type:complete len:894 (-),score=97.62 TRINITY_DN25453_c0_g2_i1:65-2746(-)